MPIRIQLSRTRGWRKPDNTVVVSRPSQWGNPHKVVPFGKGWGALIGIDLRERNGATFLGFDRTFNTPNEARGYAVELYREYLCRNIDLKARVDELRGKNLACWCPVGAPCHADVLLELANA